MKDIEGFHILWAAPYFEKSKDDTYSMQDYELLTMILSALMWRKMNGPITLYGDARAIDYVEGQGLSHIWNGGIKEIQVPDSISPGVFWAAGKLYALKAAHMPAVMVDLDLIVWKNIGEYIAGTDICAIHREGIYPDVYPGRDFFNMDSSYSFDPLWSWDVPPVNTCMLYMLRSNLRTIMWTAPYNLWRIVGRLRKICATWYLRSRDCLRCVLRERERSLLHFFLRRRI